MSTDRGGLTKVRTLKALISKTQPNPSRYATSNRTRVLPKNAGLGGSEIYLFLIWRSFYFCF